ncbi:uncharacterized protein LOC110827310 [Zootermopsis nevadensis]|uniref:uncharacterized protein LOC110827310 n=1 Tax=Zootermopsis nevadensis TaxID=136037 RepID=UPI000B8EA4CD|nr:uncharacterized protein LOC110827310 [Zootermopsis nevadensis]
MGDLLVEENMSLSSMTSRPRFQMMTCLALLFFSAVCNSNAINPFPKRWEGQDSPITGRHVPEIGDCTEGPCLEWGNFQDDERLLLLLNNIDEDNINGEEALVKRGPPSPLNAEFSLIPVPDTRARFRNSNPSQCSCRSDTTTQLDLGFGYFPRYWSHLICNDESCGSPHYRCVAMNYTVFALRTSITVDEAVRHTVNPNNRFEGVNVTVACVCQRHYPQG